jgi:hypothetical protein
MLFRFERIHPMQPSLATNPDRAANRANATHSTGPRTESGKIRSARNALTHGLTSRAAILPSEDAAVYQQHCRQFYDEYQPATPTETQLVRELAETTWRLNRIPLLEADLLSRHPRAIKSHRALATLGMHSQRLSRQFHRTLDQLRALQADRRTCEARELKQAAALLELHKHQGIPYDPAQDGFVFSNSEIEAHSRRLMRQNEAHHVAYIRFEANPQFVRAALA